MGSGVSAIDDVSNWSLDSTFLRKAEQILLKNLAETPSNAVELNYLLGLVYYHLGEWPKAISFLQEVVTANETVFAKNAVELLKKADINQLTGIDLPFGVTEPLKAENLLKPPAAFIQEPVGIQPLEPISLIECAKAAVESGVGSILGAAVYAAEKVAYETRQKDAQWSYQSWQERKSSLLGSLELAAIRAFDLNTHMLQSTYLDVVALQSNPSPLTMFQPHGQERPEWTKRFRSATGAWTTDDPMEGAAGMQFQRTGAPASHPSRRNRAEDPTLPSVRELSRKLLAVKAGTERKKVPFLNGLTIAWIQMMTHDWMSHRPAERKDGVYKIQLAPDDPFRERYRISSLEIAKTSADPLPIKGLNTFANEVTHWWDASQIYGSDQETQNRLRSSGGSFLPDGKMKLEGGSLPLNPVTQVEDTGFTRNWWLGLSLLHTLFVKHHNHICDVLKAAYKDWSTDQLFHTARLINAAITAKIHTVEWTPAVLPGVNKGMNVNWVGLIETEMEAKADRKIFHGIFEIKDPVLGGIVGGTCNNHGKPFGFSEEFVEDYRLGHPGMLDQIAVKLIDGSVQEVVDVNAVRGKQARVMIEKYGHANLLNSFGLEHMPALVNNNYPSFLTEFSGFDSSVVDLGAIDILRGRERGLPPYNEFRRQVGLHEIQKFEDLGVSDPDTLNDLYALYGPGKEGVEKLDFHIGVLCEGHRPKNFGFGETQFQIFIQMASRRLEADPFYTEKFNERYYTPEGLKLIDQADLKSILLLHYPELKQTGLANVFNAFEPWGTTVHSHPEEHPLSDPTLHLETDKTYKVESKP